MKLLLFALVASCAHRPEPMMAPDGYPAVLITCRDQTDCFRRASPACPTGYQLLDQGRSGRREVTWLIRCNPAAAPAAQPLPPPPPPVDNAGSS
jgi:hypothetical protein